MTDISDTYEGTKPLFSAGLIQRDDGSLALLPEDYNPQGPAYVPPAQGGLSGFLKLSLAGKGDVVTAAVTMLGYVVAAAGAAVALGAGAGFVAKEAAEQFHQAAQWAQLSHGAVKVALGGVGVGLISHGVNFLLSPRPR